VIWLTTAASRSQTGGELTSPAGGYHHLGIDGVFKVDFDGSYGVGGHFGYDWGKAKAYAGAILT